MTSNFWFLRIASLVNFLANEIACRLSWLDYKMATTTILKCDICLEFLLGRVPRFLDCHHSFCTPCLKQITERANLQKSVVSGIVFFSESENWVTSSTFRNWETQKGACFLLSFLYYFLEMTNSTRSRRCMYFWWFVDFFPVMYNSEWLT